MAVGTLLVMDACAVALDVPPQSQLTCASDRECPDGWGCVTVGDVGKCYLGGQYEAACGNEIVDGEVGEVCDDGNTEGGDGCSADCRSRETCGNAIVDVGAHEDCDCGAGDAHNPDCARPNGDAPDDECRSDCTRPGCGDGVAVLPEQCDGADLTGNTCIDLGYGGGTLACGLGCRFDAALCRGLCGDGITDADLEACDDGNLLPGDGCDEQCRIERCGDGKVDILEVCDDSNEEGGDGCSATCLSNERCGNGQVDLVTGEQCDDGDLDNSDLPDARCRTDCLPRRCGDGVPDAGEVCDDGNDVPGDGCSPDCLSLEECGNGIIDAAKEEVCDLGLANSQAPDARCRPDCKPRRCGDEVIDVQSGEDCEPTEPLGKPCSDFSFYGGTLACTGCRFDTNGCVGRCGDGTLDPIEQCEPGVAFTETCLDFGYYAAAGLVCSSQCSFVKTGCGGGRCGDQNVDPAEDCEPGVAMTETCSTLGYHAPEGLACGSRCRFDTTACLPHGWCGDGQVNGPEICEVTPPEGETCLTYGFDVGLLGCSRVCMPDFAACRRIGWAPVASGTPAHLHAVAGTGGLAFAVGERGTVLRWSGTSWEDMGPGTTEDLLAVWVASDGDALVAGAGGHVLRWDGAVWADTGSPAAVPIRALWGADAATIFAGGDDATILRFDGNAAWTAMTVPAGTPANASVRGLWGADATHVFAVCGSRVWTYDGAGLDWVEARWTGALMYGLWGADATHAFAVGAGGTVTRLAGTTWTQTSGGSVVLNAVFGSSASDVLAVDAAGGARHWDGVRWSEVATGVAVSLNGGFMGARDDGWLVGDLGTILRYQGAYWQTAESGTTADLWALWGDGPADVLAAGDDKTILRWDGAVWSSLSSGDPTSALFGLSGAGMTSAVAVGAARRLVRYDGASWSDMPTGLSAPLRGVWAPDPYFVFAVGDSGEALRWDGHTLLSSTPTTASLRAVWGASPTDVFAVGTQGTALHFDGTAWTQLSTVTGDHLNAVWGSGPNDVYAAGDWGTLLHYAGGEWVELPRQTTQHLYAIHGTGPDDIFVAGFAGTVLRFDGQGWHPYDPGVTTTLRAVWAHPLMVFFAGEGGVLRQLVRTGVSGPSREALCANGRDDDGDGAIDCDDADCLGAVHESSFGACRDGEDNDCDGGVDCGDSDCLNVVHENEQALCTDGVDNDCDGPADLADPQCAAVVHEDDVTLCNDAADNDGDGLVDCVDPDCAGLVLAETGDPTRCADGRDNDCNDKIDCEEPSCGFPIDGSCVCVDPAMLEDCTCDSTCGGTILTYCPGMCGP